jgi:hypothetical protein
MTTHADGVYWARWRDIPGEPFLIEKHGGDWSTFGSEDDYADDSPAIAEELIVVAGPLRAPTPRARDAEATFCWNGSEVSAELTCGHCGHTEMHDIWVDDPIECRKCLRLWRPTRTVSCELVTDEAEIAKFRLAYYGEGKVPK